MVAAQYADIPVINAGDGSHSHPTQTLTDLLTIHREKGRLDHLTIGFCGDLKYGRTVHSLLKAMSRYEGNKFVLISPGELRLPVEYAVAGTREAGSLEEAMPDLDVLYMTRVQKERFEDTAEYQRVKDSFVLDSEKMRAAKKEMIVLHPLPRVNEISRQVDSDPRAAYFRQVENGKFVRMALIITLLKWVNKESAVTNEHLFSDPTLVCPNPRCIAATEEVDSLLRRDGAAIRCGYCETGIMSK
jgi:aspartate carbamoyltransferase catalytic subunit